MPTRYARERTSTRGQAVSALRRKNAKVMSAIELAKHTLLQLGIVLLVGGVCSAVAKRLRVPDIVLYLLAGMALGPATGGLINVPAAGTLNQLLLTFGASYLLFDGGASLRFKVLKQVWITIVVISTLGLLITSAITAGVAIAAGLPAMTALLLGAVIASTDPATLVPIFRQVRIRARVAQTVVSESAFNDAMSAIVTFVVIGVAVHGSDSFSLAATAWQRIALAGGPGIAIGGGAGYLACMLTAHQKIRLHARTSAADDADGRCRHLRHSRRAGVVRFHGSLRFRHHVRQQGKLRLRARHA